MAINAASAVTPEAYKLLAYRPELPDSNGWTGPAVLVKIDGRRIVLARITMCKDAGDYTLIVDNEIYDAQIIGKSFKAGVCYLTASRRLPALGMFKADINVTDEYRRLVGRVAIHAK